MEGPPPLLSEAEKSESKDRLPVAEVFNEVIWVNPEIRAPSNMKVDEPTKLGVFISNERQERSIGTAEGHGRTGIFGKVIFEDAEGRQYRDVDAKGIGHIQYDEEVDRPKARVFYSQSDGPYASSNPGKLGIMDRFAAIKDASMADSAKSTPPEIPH